MAKLKGNSSRRAPALQENDYDHEIGLVDHAAGTTSPFASSPEPPATKTDSHDSRYAPVMAKPDYGQNQAERSESSGGGHDSAAGSPQTSGVPRTAPMVAVQAPTPLNGPQGDAQPGSQLHAPQPTKRAPPESAIDVLYENERGGFLCGMALFSSAALGNLDPPAWTNSMHKPSPTTTKTAQVPDPTWEWSWPQWHINMEDGVDAHGWEYSFMFAKRFSWHGPAWWNSFVRRRACTRERRRRPEGEDLTDPHMLSTEYFTIRPSMDLERLPTHSRQGSQAASSVKSGVETGPDAPTEQAETVHIVDMDTLMTVLRRSRIDREKMEAIQEFLEHGVTGLGDLAGHMHEIMGLFVFHASRVVLLNMLIAEHERTPKDGIGDGSEAARKERKHQLGEALKHAEEEVRRLEFWSDIKGLPEDGQATAAGNK